MDKDRILLIENQYFQYTEISMQLKDFLVFPANDEFVKVIDWVRISLTKRYDYNSALNKKRKRENATNNLVNYINESSIDLILMDHILVGHHSGENGIYLAKKLKEHGIEIPIIFFSRTPKSDKKVQEELVYAGFENSDWIEKGFAGQGIGNEWYFEKNVVCRIKEYIGQNFNSILDILINKKYTTDIERINKLRDKNWTKSQIDKLSRFLISYPNPATYKKPDLEQIINEVENGTE